ncbi:MAG: MFS transporter, partial [Steroidobacteraceae bacterium]
LLSLPILPLWSMAGSPVLLAVGAFLIQFMIQGAWGVIPAHLNELSPDAARATFPGFVYQLGNLLASGNARIQALIAVHYGGDYGFALAIVVAIVAVAIAALAGFGVESRGVSFSAPSVEPQAPDLRAESAR